MNYYDAREMKKDGKGSGKWHYTCMNDGRIWPVGYCAEHEGHPTKEEAHECYTKYCLDNHIKKRTMQNQHKCKECDAWTQESVEVGPGLGRMIYLCPDHQDRETVAKHFGSVGTMTSSY